jgi:hypothetical protein
MHAARAAEVDAVRPQLLEHPVMRALAEQVEIEIGEHLAVAIRIVAFDHVIARIGDSQPVIGARLVDAKLIQAGRVALLHRADRAARHQLQFDALGRRVERAHHRHAVVEMRTEERERVAMIAADERGDRGVERMRVAHSHDQDLSGLCYSIA